jgi:phage gp46-like protein
MSDVSLKFDAGLGEYDVDVQNGDLVPDEGLETAIIISLYADRRLEDASPRPELKTDRRGWWADETLRDDDKIGSLLWLLEREKLTDDTIKKAKQYAEDALAWMVIDQVAEAVSVAVAREGLYGLVFDIAIQKPGNVIYKYKTIWKAME